MFSLCACEDPVPKDYVEYKIIEALLIVDEPINNIRVTKTLPLFDEYDYEKALISNAKVIVSDGSKDFELVYRHSDTVGKSGYYYSDTTYLVKKNTTYSIKIILDDSTIVTGTTITPDSIYWVKRLNDVLQFPTDTIHLYSKDTMAWSKSSVSDLYMISLTCLDTLQYGMYLTPPTNEENRRSYPVYRDEFYRDRSNSSIMPATKTVVVWNFFKWFGKHSLAISVPDMNYIKWWQQSTQMGILDSKFSSISSNKSNSYGYFGSAYIIRDTIFVLKNQP